MGYLFLRAWSRVKNNKAVSILMLIEVIIGMIVFTYSSNLYFSIRNAEFNLEKQERDLDLEITNNKGSNTIPITYEEFKYIGKITNNKTYMYIVIPSLCDVDGNLVEYNILLVDYKRMGLNEEYKYWGSNVIAAKKTAKDLPKKLINKNLPSNIDKMVWKTYDDKIVFKNSVIVPISYFEKYSGDDSELPGAIHVEWNSKELLRGKKTAEKIAEYLQKRHNGNFSYRVYSPKIEMSNNGHKAQVSIDAINKASLLFTLTFIIGMVSIYILSFEKRQAIYGLSIAVGASKKYIILENLLEMLIIIGCGSILGIIIGTILTYKLRFNMMIDAIDVNLCGITYFLVLCIFLFIILIVILSIIFKIKNKTIVELLRR